MNFFEKLLIKSIENFLKNIGVDFKKEHRLHSKFFINNIVEVKYLTSKSYYKKNVPVFFFPKDLYVLSLSEPELIGFLVKLHESIPDQDQEKTHFKPLLFLLFHSNVHDRLHLFFQVLENNSLKKYGAKSNFFFSIKNENRKVGLQTLLLMSIQDKTQKNIQTRFRYYYAQKENGNTLKNLVVSFEDKIENSSTKFFVFQKNCVTILPHRKEFSNSLYGKGRDIAFLKWRFLKLSKLDLVEKVGFFDNLEEIHKNKGFGCLFNDDQNGICLDTNYVLGRVFFDFSFNVEVIVLGYVGPEQSLSFRDWLFFYFPVTYIKNKKDEKKV